MQAGHLTSFSIAFDIYTSILHVDESCDNSSHLRVISTLIKFTSPLQKTQM